MKHLVLPRKEHTNSLVSSWMLSSMVFRLTQDWPMVLTVLIMLMAKVDSIRDVIAFPKVKDASCLLTNAPDTVDEKQLEELGIRVNEAEQTEE